MIKVTYRNNCSFSFIELFVVIAIVLIVFTFSVPRLSFVNRFLVRNEVDKLFTLFSFLQQRAIASNQEQEIVFNTKNRMYSYNLKNSDISKNKKDKKNIFNNTCICKLPKVVKFGFLQDAKGPPSSPSKKITKAVTFKKINENEFRAVFYTDGKVQAGTVYFVDRGQNFMMALTCPISQVSFIRKYKYDKSRWVYLK